MRHWGTNRGHDRPDHGLTRRSGGPLRNEELFAPSWRVITGSVARTCLYENDSTVVWVDRDARVVWLVRKGGHGKSGDLEACGVELAAWMDRQHLPHALILDPRQAVGRNDADFEDEVRRFRALVWSKFAGIVHLVRSEVGRMQIQRMNDTEQSPSQVTSSEDNALELARAIAG